MQQNSDSLIEKFILGNLNATKLLYDNDLIGQLLVVMYSSIESMGLLDASPTQTRATGETFKNWVKKYILTQGQFDFDDVDLWAARCSVLHTHTSESDLSNDGKAKQIQYYSGQKDSPIAKAIVEATKDIDNGAHVMAHTEDTYLAFLNGLQNFSQELSKNCKTDQAYEIRLRKVQQQYSF